MANTKKQIELAENFDNIPKLVDLPTFRALWYDKIYISEEILGIK